MWRNTVFDVSWVEQDVPKYAQHTAGHLEVARDWPRCQYPVTYPLHMINVDGWGNKSTEIWENDFSIRLRATG